jgi:hypothetical protein
MKPAFMYQIVAGLRHHACGGISLSRDAFFIVSPLATANQRRRPRNIPEAAAGRYAGTTG